MRSANDALYQAAWLALGGLYGIVGVIGGLFYLMRRGIPLSRSVVKWGVVGAALARPYHHITGTFVAHTWLTRGTHVAHTWLARGSHVACTMGTLVARTMGTARTMSTWLALCPRARTNQTLAHARALGFKLQATSLNDACRGHCS
jgi:hypothetical protein